MSYNDLEPGTYEAQLVDWSMKMADKINQPTVVLAFAFEHQGKKHSMRFESFVFKKDGDVNKKTVDTLQTCGFKSSKIQDLIDNPSALETQRKYSIDIVKDNNGYWKIEWVNLPGGKAMDKVAAKKSLAGVDFSKFNGALMKEGFGAKKVVKNYAPGASNPPDDEINEEMGF